MIAFFCIPAALAGLVILGAIGEFFAVLLGYVDPWDFR